MPRRVHVEYWAEDARCLRERLGSPRTSRQRCVHSGGKLRPWVVRDFARYTVLRLPGTASISYDKVIKQVGAGRWTK
jgi:hypothetical protein